MVDSGILIGTTCCRRISLSCGPIRTVQLQIGGRSFEESDRTLHPLGAIPDTDKKHELICHEFGGPQEDEPILLALSGAIYQGQQQDYRENPYPLSDPPGSRRKGLLGQPVR